MSFPEACMQIAASIDDGGRLRILMEVEIDMNDTFVECEENIQRALNEAGTRATAEVLKHFDTAGQPIELEGRRFSSKGKIIKKYETPYGQADVARHVYQDSRGGATYCPLDDRAGAVLSATPKFARMIASKYADFGSSRVREDMAVNHGRLFSRGYVSSLAEAVASIAESLSDQTIYRLPDFHAKITTLVVATNEIEITAFRPNPAVVSVALIAFYDERELRQHVIYLADILRPGTSRQPTATTPARFFSRVTGELKRARQLLDSSVRIIGISDGLPRGTDFLDACASIQFIDPEKVAELLSEAAGVYFDRYQTVAHPKEALRHRDVRGPQEKVKWIRYARSQLRSQSGLESLIRELRWWRDEVSEEARHEKIVEVLGFMETQSEAGRMNYSDPSASFAFANAGILEGSAKVMFGDRIGHPKFKIGLSAAKAILILRELTRSSGRWEEFWNHVARRDKDQNRGEPH
jgi:hypothetical protein